METAQISYRSNAEDFPMADEPGGRERPYIQPVRTMRSPQGALGVVEHGGELSFDFERFYFITSVPEAAERGSHAHKRLRQCMICLSGRVTVELSDARSSHCFELTSSEQALIVPPGYWRVLRDFAAGTVVGVLASDRYDEDDYIRDRDEFDRWDAARDAPGEVPFLPLGRYVDRSPQNDLAQQLHAATHRVVSSGTYIGGNEVAAFEEAFAAYCGTAHAVGVANGLEALQLALLALGIGAGDEVIVPAHTFVATAFAVDQVGARAVLADVESATGLIDPARVKHVVTSRTRAIVPVHLYGQAADMDALSAFATKSGIALVEDAAQAQGARYKGRRCGSLGRVAAFSFYPTKNLGAVGDAGAVTTNDKEIARQVRKLANYGSSVRYRHECSGMNSRLDPIQAAVLAVKLHRLDEWNGRRRAIAGRYLSAFAHLKGIDLPVVHPWSEPVWHVFQIRVLHGRRDVLKRVLEEQGIGTNIHYPIPIHRQSCYAHRQWQPEDFPVADQFCLDTLSLPLDPLHTVGEVDRVIAAVRRFLGATEESTP